MLAMRSSHRLAVFEIGMNHRGETRELAAIAQPTIAVITNAQREHQEFMVSVDEVAAEHADAIRALRQGGTAIVNADDPRAGMWHAAARDTGVDVVTFGLDRPADIRARHAPHPEGGVAGARDAVGQCACRAARAGPAHGLQRTGRSGCRVCGRRAVDGHRGRTRGVPAGARTARHAAHRRRCHGDRRHVQRKSRLGARGHRRPCGATRAALARARRHG